MDIDTWMEIEEIKKLKARYFRTMDLKLWDEFAEVFTEDATFEMGRKRDFRRHGRDEIVGWISSLFAEGTSVHHGHMPEIEITSSTTASGIWSMFDYLRLPSRTLYGYGHYHEEYVKEDGRWKIRSIWLTRLRTDVTPVLQDKETPSK